MHIFNNVQRNYTTGVLCNINGHIYKLQYNARTNNIYKDEFRKRLNFVCSVQYEWINRVARHYSSSKIHQSKLG